MGGSPGALIFGFVMIGGVASSALAAFVLLFWFLNSIGPKATGLGLAIGLSVAALVVLPVWPSNHWPVAVMALINAGLAVAAVARNRARKWRAAIPAVILLLGLATALTLLLPVPRESTPWVIAAMLTLFFLCGWAGFCAFLLSCLCHKPLNKFGVMNDAV